MRIYMDDVRPCPPGWTVARTVAETQAHLELGGIVDLSLDHDMGACDECIASVPKAAATLHCEHVPDGMSLVRWMIERDLKPEHMPVVHSANPIGARRMRESIAEWWYR